MSRGRGAAHDEAGSSTRPLRSVVKTFAVIDALIERGEASAAELAELVAEPRSSVYRMLGTLQPSSSSPAPAAGSTAPGWASSASAARYSRASTSEPWQCRCSSACVRKPRDGPPGRPPGLSGRLHRTAPRGALAHPRGHLGGALPLHVGAAPRTLLAYEPARSGTSTSQRRLEQWTDRSPATRQGCGSDWSRCGPGVASATRTSSSASPQWPRRSSTIAGRSRIPRLQSLPQAFRHERKAWAELARTAGIDASRAFGYSGRAAPQATDEA